MVRQGEHMHPCLTDAPVQLFGSTGMLERSGYTCVLHAIARLAQRGLSGYMHEVHTDREQRSCLKRKHTIAGEAAMLPQGAQVDIPALPQHMGTAHCCKPPPASRHDCRHVAA